MKISLNNPQELAILIVRKKKFVAEVTEMERIFLMTINFKKVFNLNCMKKKIRTECKKFFSYMCKHFCMVFFVCFPRINRKFFS